MNGSIAHLHPLQKRNRCNNININSSNNTNSSNKSSNNSNNLNGSCLSFALSKLSSNYNINTSTNSFERSYFTEMPVEWIFPSTCLGNSCYIWKTKGSFFFYFSTIITPKGFKNKIQSTTKLLNQQKIRPKMDENQLEKQRKIEQRFVISSFPSLWILHSLKRSSRKHQQWSESKPGQHAWSVSLT